MGEKSTKPEERMSSIHRAATLLGLFTILSQVFGLIRDRLLASSFGAGTALDIYYASFKIPDLVLVIVGSIASLAILVPSLTREKRTSDDSARGFVSEIFSVLLVLLVVGGMLVWVFVPELTSLLFPGFRDPMEHGEIVRLTRLLLLSPLILGISNLFASIVHVSGKFLYYALAPVLYNIGIILGILFLYPHFGLLGIGWGVIIGAVSHALVQLPVVIKERLFPRFSLHVNWKRMFYIVRTSIPRSLTLSLNQVLITAFIGIASLVATGLITIFTFAYNLQSVPLSIIGASYSLAAFPALSRSALEKGNDEFGKEVFDMAAFVLLLSTVAAVIMILLRVHIVDLLYGAGEFGAAAVRRTGIALLFFSLSLPAQTLILLFTRVFYAAGDTKTPLKSVAVGVSVALGAGALWILTDPSNNATLVDGARALPIFFSGGMFLIAIGLLLSFKKKVPSVDFSLLRLPDIFLTSAVSLAAGLLIMWASVSIFAPIFPHTIALILLITIVVVSSALGVLSLRNHPAYDAFMKLILFKKWRPW